MPESFGARLRRRREEQGIALATIAEQTKIKASLLEALERDDVSHWPSGIFRRAFIRAYAHAVGLNPDVVVSEFLALYPDPAEIIEAAPLTDSDARARGGPPTRLRNLVGSAIESISKLRRNAPNEEAAIAAPVEVPEVEATEEGPVEPVPVSPPLTFEPDLLAAANLCTELARVEGAADLQPLLQKAAEILDAIGLIVWVWDGIAEELRPSMAYGYSDRVLAQLPTVKAEADNATAAAFRSRGTCTIDGGEYASGALVAPLMTPAGCAGVLALELPRGSEHTASVRAIATIFAAQLARLMDDSSPAAIRARA